MRVYSEINTIIAGKNLGFLTVGVLCGIRARRLLDSKPDKIFNHTLELMGISLKILITGGFV